MLSLGAATAAAVVYLTAFAWFELVYPYGRERRLDRGEVFSV